MRFFIDEVEVHFPYRYIYPEQYEYMKQLKYTLDAKGHCVLEMPTGTGKTAALLCLILAYQRAHSDMGKLIYCTRTVPEMEKVLTELKIVYNCWRSDSEPNKSTNSDPRFFALGLSARRSLCIHPQVSQQADREKVDEKCRTMTAPWIMSRNASVPDIEDGNRNTCDKSKVCEYFFNLETFWSPESVAPGIYTLDDFKLQCSSWTIPDPASNGMDTIRKPYCPYFASRRLMHSANVVVLNYQYLLDPKVSQAAFGSTGTNSFRGKTEDSKSSPKEPVVVVMDEAHNIDNVCLESLSVNVDLLTLEKAKSNITSLEKEVQRLKAVDHQRLLDEYMNIVSGIRDTYRSTPYAIEMLENPVLPEDLVNETIPGNLRKAEFFLLLLKKIIAYLKNYTRVFEVRSEGPLSFLNTFENDTCIDSKILKFFYERLRSLLNTLQVTNLHDYTPLTLVADFCTLVSTYWQGFIVITDPYPEATGIYDPLLQLSCLDSSIAMRPVFNRYQSVVLTSGTISPLSLYPRLLRFEPVITQSFPISLDRNCICPLIVSRGADQIPLTSRFDMRSDVSVINNYGTLISDLCANVPDGIVCFFTSYIYMDYVICQWYESGVIQQILEKKLIFIETKDVVSTTLALHNYRKACDNGRGAIFFSVARGKVAEGIDFDRHFGRCVVLLGIPYQYTLSRILKARLEYLRENLQLAENEFLTFDAMRQAAQCVGRVIRSKMDYGLMVFADYRFNRMDKRSKLPEWIRGCLDNLHINLSSDLAVSVARKFLLDMSQSFEVTTRTRFDENTMKALTSQAPL